MKRIEFLLIFISLLFLLSCTDNGRHISPTKEYAPDIENQSDITYNSSKDEYIISSDDGYIYTLDSSFRVINKTFIENTEFISVFYNKSSLFLANKLNNRFYRIILPAYKVIQSNFRIIGISANEKAEVISMTYDDCGDEWIIIQDLDPPRINFYDGDFHFIKKDRLQEISRIAACNTYESYIYVLSEEGSIYKLNPADLSIIHSWNIEVDDPEGICFDEKGNIIVLSGMEGKILLFEKELFDL